MAIYRLFRSVSVRRMSVVFFCPVYPPSSVFLLSFGSCSQHLLSAYQLAGFATALRGLVIFCLSAVRRRPPPSVAVLLFFLICCMPRRVLSSRLCVSATHHINFNI